MNKTVNASRLAELAVYLINSIYKDNEESHKLLYQVGNLNKIEKYLKENYKASEPDKNFYKEMKYPNTKPLDPFFKVRQVLLSATDVAYIIIILLGYFDDNSNRIEGLSKYTKQYLKALRGLVRAVNKGETKLSSPYEINKSISASYYAYTMQTIKLAKLDDTEASVLVKSVNKLEEALSIPAQFIGKSNRKDQ